MAAPTGTVTLLFTDIAGSTRLWEERGTTMAGALERHDALLRTVMATGGGHVFKTVGDAFCVAFDGAGPAVRAAVEAQRALQAEPWPAGTELRVRMALHTGECVERDGDYFGPVVNRVARLEAVAHGSQVVVSGVTAALVRDRLPAGVSLVPLGRHVLKDLGTPEEVFQLTVEGLASEFPALRSPEQSPPTNLAESLSTLVGRDAEVAVVTGLLGDHRSVTLVGSGGSGKTRLALEVARNLLPDMADGVWVAHLAPVTDDGAVADQLLTDLGIAGRTGLGSSDTLIAALGDQTRLLVLDNCEQVVDGCAALAAAVLTACPHVRLLATSREPLRIAGEYVHRVPSLSLPVADALTLDDLRSSGAVALFVDRARAQVPEFDLTQDEVPVITAVCRRLDGMPLALELAAARLRSLTLSQLDERLEHRFRVLTGGSRVALPRQQTLRALVDWSYDLLPPEEQLVFRCTSVFVGGFGLDAAEAVCDDGDVRADDVLDVLTSLVDKSLVVAEPAGRNVRYRLLESLREYGIERLEEPRSDGPPDERETVAERHARHYLDLAEEAAGRLVGPDSRLWFDRLGTEDLNVRAAVSVALGSPDGPRRVLGAMWGTRAYWAWAPRPASMLAHVDRALDDLGTELDPTTSARAQLVRADLLERLDLAQHLDAVLAAVDAARQSDDTALEIEALAVASEWLGYRDSAGDADRVGSEALARARAVGDPALLGRVLFHVASGLGPRFTTGVVPAASVGARELFDEALVLTARVGDIHTEAKARNNLAWLLASTGDLEGAERHFRTNAEAMGGDPITLENLGSTILQRGDVDEAESHYLAALRLCRIGGYVTSLPAVVRGLAACAAVRGDLRRAGLLAGAADRLVAGLGTDPGWANPYIDDRISEARVRSGDEFDLYVVRGRAMSDDAVVNLALVGEDH